MCNSCRRERQKSSYYKHHKTNLDRIKNYKKQNRDWFVKIKSQLSCCVCGETESVCLDFHHLDESKKEFNLAGHEDLSREKVIAEMNKCACLCSNCHRKHHAGKLFTPLVKLEIT